MLNISDKRFKMGGKVFWKQMISLKQSDADSYNEKRNIIEDSIDVANGFFEYHKEVLQD